MIDDLVAQKPDAIIMAASNADAVVPVAKKAKTSGIKVITYDGDVADATAHQWFVNQETFTQAGAALVDVVAEQAGASSRFAVVSTDPGAFSQNSWIAAMKAQMQAKYPKMQLVDIGYGQNKPTESFSAAQDLISKHRGQLDAIVVPSVVALPKVAEAVEEAGLTGKIVVTGMSTPNQIREFVKRGTCRPSCFGIQSIWPTWPSTRLRPVWRAPSRTTRRKPRCPRDGWARAPRSNRSRTSWPRIRSHLRTRSS
jgi:rhamnose transport system substrate-binding protein